MGVQELGIILVILLVIFGGSQLPKLARNLGQAQKEFKDGLDVGEQEAAAKRAKEAADAAAIERATPPTVGRVDGVTDVTSRDDKPLSS